MTIIVFTGHRDAHCHPHVFEQLLARFPGATWIHGGAEGFDTQVDEWAKAHGIEPKVVRPKYDLFPSEYRNRAPIARNYDMVDVADVVVICYDGKRTRGGTWETYQYAKQTKRPYWVVKAHPIPRLSLSSPE